MRKSQQQKIIAYLKEHGSITAREASRKLDVDRLSARIYDLRKRGYEFKPTQHRTATSRGVVGQYTRYWLVEVKG